MVDPMLQSERQGAGHQNTYLLTDLLPHEKPVWMGRHQVLQLSPHGRWIFWNMFSSVFLHLWHQNIADISHQPTIHQLIYLPRLCSLSLFNPSESWWTQPPNQHIHHDRSRSNQPAVGSTSPLNIFPRNSFASCWRNRAAGTRLHNQRPAAPNSNETVVLALQFFLVAHRKLEVSNLIQCRSCDAQTGADVVEQEKGTTVSVHFCSTHPSLEGIWYRKKLN